jgi:hypothetical protein
MLYNQKEQIMKHTEQIGIKNSGERASHVKFFLSPVAATTSSPPRVSSQIQRIQEGWRAKVIDANGNVCSQVISRLGKPVLIYERAPLKLHHEVITLTTPTL